MSPIDYVELTRELKRRHDKKAKDKTIGKFIGIVLAPFVVGLVYMWYNYLFFQFEIPYWKWAVIGGVMTFLKHTLLNHKWIGQFLNIFLGVAILVQVLSWLKIVTLPVF